jgi:hypothetical protein
MPKMKEDNFRLYVGRDISHYRTMEKAKEAAKLFMPKKPELRIEILMEVDLNEADWWAYNYITKEWVPS